MNETFEEKIVARYYPGKRDCLGQLNQEFLEVTD